MYVTDIQKYNFKLSLKGLDDKILFGKIRHLEDPKTIKMLVRGLYRNQEFHVPFWSMIYVASKFTLPV